MLLLQLEWMDGLSLQQQAVLWLALRGPDGDPKFTTFKRLLRAMRATCMRAAHTGEACQWGQAIKSFMGLDEFADHLTWKRLIDTYLEDDADGAILHHYTHFMHAAEVCAYLHPEPRFRERWWYCYWAFANRLHLMTEGMETMQIRLNDFGRFDYGQQSSEGNEEGVRQEEQDASTAVAG